MSRFASDLKPMLKIMAGNNADKLNLDEPVDVKEIRVFFQYDNGGGYLVSSVDDDIRNAMTAVVKHFTKICDKTPKKIQINSLKESTQIWLANMKGTTDGMGFEYQLLNLEGRISPPLELLKWLFGRSSHTFIAIMTAWTDKTGSRPGTSRHTHRVRQKENLIKEFQSLLGSNGVFLYPTHPTAAPYHNEPIARAFNFSYTAIVNILGLPATAIPLGIGKEGLPIGIQVVANVNEDKLCLAVAKELESVFNGHQEP